MVNGDIKDEKLLSGTSHKRYDFMDVAKGIGILFVVFAHVNSTPAPLKVIYSFHMPLFFIMAGMLFNRSNYQSFGAFLKRKVQTLICPYILFYLISILFDVVMDFIRNAQGIDLSDIGTQFLQMFINQGSGHIVINAPLWFIPCLFVVEIAYYFISKLSKPMIIVISTLMTTAGWFIMSDIINFDNSVIPWSLDSALFSIGFFALGNLSFNYICTAAEKIGTVRAKAIIYIIIFLVATGALIPLALYNGKVSIGSKYLSNGFILYATGILGLIAILSLSTWLQKSKFLRYCGRNSFSIMAFHCLMKRLVKAVYTVLGMPEYNETNFVETIVPAIAVTILTLLLVLFYNKVKPIFKGKSRKATV